MAQVQVAQLGLLQGGTDSLEGFLKLSLAEVMAAYNAASVTNGRHKERNIQNGKSAEFPCIGRTSAVYLKPGESLDDKRTNIPNARRTIVIDGLLTSNQLITDLEEAMLHYDVRGEYTKQMGIALAQALDAGRIAEIAKEAASGKENITGLGKGGVLSKTVTSKGITAETGAAIIEMLLDMKVKMKNNYVPDDGRVVYIKPEGAAALIQHRDVLNKDYGSPYTIIEGEVKKVCGFDLVECPHLTKGGVDNENVLQGGGHIFPADYAKNAMFVAAHRDTIGTLILKSMQVEHARRAEYQADMLVAKMAVGIGGLRPEAAFLGVIA